MVHVPLIFLSEWREFPSAPCLAGKKKSLTARVSMLLKKHASPDMLPFSLCNNKRLAIRHMNRPLFPTTLSIPSYDIGKYVGLRTYQHPLVLHALFYITRSYTWHLQNVAGSTSFLRYDYLSYIYFKSLLVELYTSATDCKGVNG